MRILLAAVVVDLQRAEVVVVGNDELDGLAAALGLFQRVLKAVIGVAEVVDRDDLPLRRKARLVGIREHLDIGDGAILSHAQANRVESVHAAAMAERGLFKFGGLVRVYKLVAAML